MLDVRGIPCPKPIVMALNELKGELGLEKDGIADHNVWQKLLE